MSRFGREGAFFILFSVVSVGGCEKEATKTGSLAGQGGGGGKVAGENKHAHVVCIAKPDEKAWRFCECMEI